MADVDPLAQCVPHNNSQIIVATLITIILVFMFFETLVGLTTSKVYIMKLLEKVSPRICTLISKRNIL